MKLDAKKYPVLSGMIEAAGTKMEFALRAECLPDVLKFMETVNFSEYTIKSKFPPDVELEFKSDRSLDEIKSVLKTIPDSHVMLETVNLKKDYTGKR